MMDVAKQLVCVVLLVLLVGSYPALAAEKIDVNSATVEQLVTVKGVGEVLAERIVAYRQEHERFRSLDELNKVKGVGSKKLAKMLPYLTLSKK